MRHRLEQSTQGVNPNLGVDSQESRVRGSVRQPQAADRMGFCAPTHTLTALGALVTSDQHLSFT